MCSFNVFSVVHRESLYLSIFVYMDSLRASATLLSSSIFFYFKCYIFQFQHFHYILFHSFCFILFCFSRQLTQLLSKSLTFHSILLSLAPLSLSYACMFQGLVRNLDKLHTEILVFPSAALSSFRNTPPFTSKQLCSPQTLSPCSSDQKDCWFSLAFQLVCMLLITTYHQAKSHKNGKLTVCFLLLSVDFSPQSAYSCLLPSTLGQMVFLYVVPCIELSLVGDSVCMQLIQPDCSYFNRTATDDFCILTMCPATLLNSLSLAVFIAQDFPST